MSKEAQSDLIGLQNALLNIDGVEQFLHELAVLCTRVATGGLSCGMTLRQRGRPPVTGCTDLNDQLRSSMASRSVIDQAAGVIMATERCAQDKAFALLRTVSQNTNVKLRDLAVTIVTSVSGEPPRPASFEDG